MQESEKWKWSPSVVSDSSRPHGLQPARLLHPWDWPGKSTEVGCHCLLHIEWICSQIFTSVSLHDLQCSKWSINPLSLSGSVRQTGMHFTKGKTGQSYGHWTTDECPVLDLWTTGCRKIWLRMLILLGNQGILETESLLQQRSIRYPGFH